MIGYRVGVIQADEDVQKFTDNKLSGIDAAQDKIKCPPDSFNADFCASYNNNKEEKKKK